MNKSKEPTTPDVVINLLLRQMVQLEQRICGVPIHALMNSSSKLQVEVEMEILV